MNGHPAFPDASGAVDPERAKLTRSAAIASIAVALFLAGLKGWATWRTGSAAMLGSLADTMLDLAASVVTLLGVWIAAQPADHNHRFGHGKAEPLAAMLQVMLIAVSAGGIAWRSVAALLAGGRTSAAGEGIAVSVVAIAVTLGLLAWQRHVIARTRSVAIRTDHLHYQSDLMLNLAVIAALTLDQFAGFAPADPLFGLAIAAWLVRGAWRGARESMHHLMDTEWPAERRRAFVAGVARHPEVSHLHDLRTRSTGDRDFAQCHIALPADMSVAEAHDVMDRVEETLQGLFPGLDLLIHVDPEGQVDQPGNLLVEADELAKPGAAR